jgi:tetratricopeptide (TPR) repeat protein
MSVATDQAIRDSQDRQEEADAVASDWQEPKTPATESSLEPVARVSDYEPELAEPELAEPEPAGKRSKVANEQVEVTDASANQMVITPTPARDVPAPSIPAPSVQTRPRIEPLDSQSPVAGFSGVQPGISSRSDVLAKWGEPNQRPSRAAPDRATPWSYQFDDLYQVLVYFNRERVRLIRISLTKPRPAKELMSCLHLGDLRPATLRTEQGDPVALVFPEHGVELNIIAPETNLTSADSRASEGVRIQKIAIRPIEAAAFMLRAENDLLGSCAENMKDLQRALELDSRSARAHWLLSVVRLHVGQASQAERLADRAVELAPNEEVYRLHWAKCLKRQARYDAAVEQTRQVLEGASATPIVRAQALYQMGQLASLGSKKIAQRAVALHLKSIEIADRLASIENDKVQQAARKLLINAHLAVAMEVARGKWQQKTEYVAQWVARASALAEEMADHDTQALRARLQVAVSALTAVASLDSPIDPELWVEEAAAASAQLHEMIPDELARQQIDWDLGIAYFQAAQIEHRRGWPDQALAYGQQAESLLAPLAVSRSGLPDTDHLLGRVYFQLGAVYAVHLEDHAKACQWYDRAADRLLKQVPVTSMAVPGRHGDALVSMGVSYWHTMNRRRALELTQAGADLVEEVVTGGILPVDALAVPYGNLAAMYKAQGEQQPAMRYARLASQHETVQSANKRQ